MVSLISLWLPILLSAVFVFVVSSFIHMALPWHKNDMRKLEKEDEVMAALRPFAIPPGDYGMPVPKSMAEMKTPAFGEKMKQGPVAHLTVVKSGPPRMGLSLLLWFFYSLVVSLFAAYIASRALPAGAHYLQVFRFAGAVAFAGYSLGLLQGSIWYGRSWWTTFKSVLDGFLYALLTAGTLGWLWPR